MDMIEFMSEFEIAGNQLWRILGLLGVIFLSFILAKILKTVFNTLAVKFENKGRFTTATTLNAVAKGITLFSVAFGIYIGLAFLNLQSKVAEISDTISAILLTLGIGYVIYWLVDVPTNWFARTAVKTESQLNDMLVPITRKSLRVTIVLLICVQIAQTLSDKPITSIIAGLGIGGLAVALAAQDSIKNFFGSIIIFIDKPFAIGDRIVVDGHDGPVEEVGLRSTKIRTLDGHLVVVPNGQLANMTIQNIGKRPYIRRLANITITYDTPSEKIDQAIEIIKELLENHEGMKEDFPPRVFFNDYNAASLNIMVIYWYHPPNYWDFMVFNERFNKQLFERFGEAGIDFAFPTQTIYLAGDSSRPLEIGLKKE